MHHLDQPRELALDHRHGVAQHDGGRSVEHVGAGEPVVEPSSLGAETLGDRAQECDHVVLRLALDLACAFRIDLGRLGANALPIGGRDDARIVEGFDGEKLDPQPGWSLRRSPKISRISGSA